MTCSRRASRRSPAERLLALAAAARARGPVLDLTVSNPTRVGLDYPPDLLAGCERSGALTYRPQPLGLPDAREAIAADYARRGLRVEPDRIVLTASTSEAYSFLFKLLCDAGRSDVLTPVAQLSAVRSPDARSTASAAAAMRSSTTAGGRSTCDAVDARVDARHARGARRQPEQSDRLRAARRRRG